MLEPASVVKTMLIQELSLQVFILVIYLTSMSEKLGQLEIKVLLSAVTR